MASERNEIQPGLALFDVVWRVFTDLRMTLALLMSAAVILVISVLLPGVMGSAAVLRVVLALLAFSLALRLAAHVETAARLWSRRYSSPEPGLSAETVVLEESPEEAQLRAQAALSATYDRVIVEDASPQRLVGIRRPAAAAGPILAATGPLVVLLGLLINATVGSTARDVVLVDGAETTRTGMSEWKVGLRAFSPAIAVESPDGETAYYAIAPLRPVLQGLHWIFPREDGPALYVTAKTTSGQNVELLGLEPGANPESALNLPFRGNQAEQTFTAPAQGLAFRAVSYPALPERGVAGPVFLLEAYREGEATAVLNELVEERAALTVDDTTYLMQRGRYVTADIAYAPGWPLLALGALTILAGLAIVFFLPVVEVWVDVYGEGRRALARVQAAGGLAPERATAELVAALQAPVLSAEEQHSP